MMSLDQPVFFLATQHPSRTRAFYEEVLGLTFVADEPMALVFRIGDRPLRIQKVDHFEPASHTVLGWEVQDLEAEVRNLSDRCVLMERYDFLQQDEIGIWTSPSGSRVAWFKDPCGNLLSLTETPADRG